MENLQLIEEIQHSFEQHRRSYGSVTINDSDESDSSTNSDSPFISDEEPMPSYDEYQLQKTNPGSGPLKLYIKERLSKWPKYRYKKYKQRHIKKYGIQMNYGNFHTKQIKDSLKDEKFQRKKDEDSCLHLKNMMEDLPKQTSFLSLDGQQPIRSILKHTTSISRIKTNENDQEVKRSSSKLREMKNKFQKH